MLRTVHVAAPSRLHFGLWSLAPFQGRQYGGVGAMVDRPGLKIRIEPGQARGDKSDSAIASANLLLHARIAPFIHSWAAFHHVETPQCSIHIDEAPPQHVGLGTGTQLGLAIAAGLNAFCGLPSQSPQELALSVRRGLRSAVGTYGFVFGGLVVEQGKLPGEPISPLDCRIDLPSAWRFVLVRDVQASGLAGEDESSVMATLANIPPAVTEELIALVRDRLIPAAATHDFAAFADSLYRYGNLSGQCFAPRQGGPYNGPRLTSLVERFQALGHRGVGQSSWGPTLYVATASAANADQFVGNLRRDSDVHNLEIVIASPCNNGARIDVWER